MFSPFGLVLVEDLALGVVANGLDVDEAPDVELLGTEHRHDDGVCAATCYLVDSCTREVGLAGLWRSLFVFVVAVVAFVVVRVVRVDQNSLQNACDPPYGLLQRLSHKASTGCL